MVSECFATLMDVKFRATKGISYMDMKQFWGSVNNVKAQIGIGVSYITSLDLPYTECIGGVTVEANQSIAAQAIVKGTHRRATPEEIESFKAATAEHIRDTAARKELPVNTQMLGQMIAATLDQVRPARNPVGRPPLQNEAH